MSIGILLVLVIGLSITIGFFLSKREKEVSPSDPISEKFKNEQKALNEFNEQFNFLTEGYQKALISKYLELLMNRIPSENEQIENQVRQGASQLIFYYERIIKEFKIGNIDNKHLDEYRKTYASTIKENRDSMDFIAVYSLIGLELMMKLWVDAKNNGNVKVEKRTDLEIKVLNQTLLDLLK